MLDAHTTHKYFKHILCHSTAIDVSLYGNIFSETHAFVEPKTIRARTTATNIYTKNVSIMNAMSHKILVVVVVAVVFSVVFRSAKEKSISNESITNDTRRS